mmetsp:Transcript_9311/g.22605  ORF Transcript_9311/g.22605 Transcript_9311/m.22605 type:complete len:225 (+) Transcript_9311:234-908(+)
MRLKTPNPNQTPVRPTFGGKYQSAQRHPSVAVRVLRDSCRNEPVPIMIPSPIKTSPLMICSTLAIMAGSLAASRTSCSGVALNIAGSRSICSDPRAQPSTKPQLIRRLEVALAYFSPPMVVWLASSTRSTMALGTMICATVDSASKTIPPTWKVWIAMACAAAATPLWSIDCVTRATARNVRLRDRLRSCRAAPPLSSGLRLAHDGGRNNFPQDISCFFRRSPR